MTSDDERVDRALAVLSRGPHRLAWRDSQELKRAVRRRQVRQRSGIAAAGVAAGTALAVGAAAMVSGPVSPQPPVRLAVAARLGSAAELMAKVSPLSAAAGSAERAAVAATEQGFAVRLLQQVSRTHTGNLTVSPMSLAVALTMLENGAVGETQSQIAATLGSSALAIADQDRGWASLLSSLRRAGSTATVSLQSADSLWLQKRLQMQPAFMAAMARYFATGVWQCDFARNLPGAERAINQWVSQHTNGKITKLFAPGDLSQSTVAVLANAVHFLASWQTPFEPDLTAAGLFHTSQGQAVRVAYMDQLVQHAVVTSGYQAVQLPYAGGRFAAVAIMPRGQSLAGFVNGLTPAQLSRIIGAARRGESAYLSLPRFTTHNYLNLRDTLSAMGMPMAFTPAADFSAMIQGSVQVQSAVQRDYLSVAEKGTEAAAATGISVMPTSYVYAPSISFDHPFLFLIRDTLTGTVLFASLVQQPGATTLRMHMVQVRPHGIHFPPMPAGSPAAGGQ